MRRAIAPLLVVLLILPLVALGTLGAAPAGERPDRPVDLSQNPRPGIGTDPVPLPTPVLPAPTSVENGFQLVGFTGIPFPGNKGLLNYTLACQAEFPNSRFCTLSEVRETTSVPPVSRCGLAWVRDEGRLSPTLAPAAGSRADAVVADDCSCWTSADGRTAGTAMTFGPESMCYGGLRAVSCDTELYIACCARLTE